MFLIVGNILRNKDTLYVRTVQDTHVLRHMSVILACIVRVQEIELTRGHDFYHARSARV